MTTKVESSNFLWICCKGVRWHMQAWEQLENWKSSGKGMGDRPCGHNLQGYRDDSWHQEKDKLPSSWRWLQHFEGQELLLFNLDNHHLFHYSFLFGYMHNMLEEKYSIATFTSSTSSPSQSMECICPSIGHQHGTAFQYPVCGPCPVIVVWDSTMIDYQKDLLPLIVNHKLANSQPSHYKVMTRLEFSFVVHIAKQK